MTLRGKDYFLALLFATGISAVSGLRNFVELCFSLSVIALLSLLAFQLSATRNLKVIAKPSRIRIFKRGTAEVSFDVHSAGWSWFGLSSATARSGRSLVVEPRTIWATGGTFGVTGRMAGRHDTLELDVTLSDTLGLFRLNRSVRVDGYVAEVLSLALRGAPPVLAISGSAMGETSGGRRGSGQELYAIEEYGPETERRDIIWKRVARHPEGDLLSRVREANLPDSIEVCLLQGEGTNKEVWMDLASEAVSQLGVDLIGLGMGIRVPIKRGDHAGKLSAYTRDELAELTIAIWQPDLSLEPDIETLSNSGILIAEEVVLKRPEVMKLSMEMPSIIVSEAKEHGKGKEGVIRFSGTEDLSSAIIQVIGQ